MVRCTIALSFLADGERRPSQVARYRSQRQADPERSRDCRSKRFVIAGSLALVCRILQERLDNRELSAFVGLCLNLLIDSSTADQR
jgi:hypothetical protein